MGGREWKKIVLILLKRKKKFKTGLPKKQYVQGVSKHFVCLFVFTNVFIAMVSKKVQRVLKKEKEKKLESLREKFIHESIHHALPPDDCWSTP